MSSTGTISIREASVDDIPEILRLYAQPGYDDGKVLDEAAARAIFLSMADYPFYRAYLASTAEGAAGIYMLLVMHNLGHLGARSAIVEGVAVDPALHGRGIGRAMMHHACGQAAAQGCYKLALSSNLKRADAHAFYDSLGFRRHGLSFVVETDAAGKDAAA